MQDPAWFVPVRTSFSLMAEIFSTGPVPNGRESIFYLTIPFILPLLLLHTLHSLTTPVFHPLSPLYLIVQDRIHEFPLIISPFVSVAN